MRLKIIATAVLVAAMGAGAVLAADGAHQAREGMMKKISGATGQLGAIAKGTKPYDAAVVKTALTTISETAKAFPDQFGPSSDRNDKSASPKIWEDMADFKARADKLSGEAEMALAQLPADKDAVAATVKTLGENCGACHQVYRLKD